ncbi:MAG: RNase adapter RapZ, partial [Actinomycetota bacterium]
MSSDLELVVLTGLSGAGRSTAAHALEDIGFMVLDNLPPQLLPEAVGLVESRKEVQKIAIVADSRGGSLFHALENAIAEVRSKVGKVTIVFLEASDHALVRRFESSRRPHPMQGDGALLPAVQAERELLMSLRDQADLIIDTTERNVHDLRRAIDAAFDNESAVLRATITSFGFKYGIPVDADYVADVRFLPNPFWQEELKHLTGTDAAVNDYVVSHTDAQLFLDKFTDLLNLVTDGYIREGKRYVTVAIGCTGGQHRSVAIAENLTA